MGKGLGGFNNAVRVELADRVCLDVGRNCANGRNDGDGRWRG